jgi:hypothetical protein
LIDTTTNLKVKQWKNKEFGVCFLTGSILGVEGRAGILGWGLKRMTSRLIIHIDLHKPNNKLVSGALLVHRQTMGIHELTRFTMA